VQRVGSIGWLDADWAIDAIKGDFPTIASLFLGWRKANNWLKRQCEIIRNEFEGRTIPNSEPIKLRNPLGGSEPRKQRNPKSKSEPDIVSNPHKRSEPRDKSNPKNRSEP
jgi:hypothetical protein